MKHLTPVYTAEDVKCEYCTEYARKTGCKLTHCPYIPERLAAGVLRYQDLVETLHPNHQRLPRRLQTLVNNPTGFWQGDHLRRMRDQNAAMGYRKKRNTYRYYAVMYLLTSSEELFRHTANCFLLWCIDLQYVVYPDLLLRFMYLIIAAEMIQKEKDAELLAYTYQLENLEDREFALIINALLITQYGLDAFHVKDGEIL